jgi:phosphohistidine phosphatase
MKTLIVVRHAKSSWDHAGLSDFNRPLNDRGQRDAPRMANVLKEKNLAIDAVLSSPAVRAVTTCHVFMDVLGIPKNNIQLMKELYHAGDETILRIVKDIHENPDVAMLFGHNPGLTDFVNDLLDEEIDNIPTTGIVACRLKVEKWSEVKWGSGEMMFFEWPKNVEEKRK